MIDRSLSARLEAAILSLLRQRPAGSSICPSDAARLVATTQGVDWRDLMAPTRKVASQLALAGRLRITRGEAVLDPRDLGRGPIRLRLVATEAAPPEDC